MKQEELSETDFASQVESLLEIGHWLWYHPRPARIRVKGQETYRTAIAGHRGYPDYCAVSAERKRLLFIELKSETGKLTEEQETWLDELKECQKTITMEPVQLSHGKVTLADMTFTGNTPLFLVTVPEIFLWRPSQLEEIKGILR